MPKKVYPENIQKLKDQLETGNNLIDYFFVCGLPPSTCQKDDLYNVSAENYTENINKLLKPTIVSKFPEFDKNNDTIDESIISYCFPEGFGIVYNNTPSGPKKNVFSIILDNNLYSSDYPQKYLTCILFYEKLSLYKKLQQQIEKVQKMNEILPLDDSQKIPVRTEKNFIHKHTKIMTTISPVFNINDIVSPNTKKNESDKSDNLNPYKNYYVPKCICLISIHPYVKLYQKILNNILSYGCSNVQGIPLEKIILNLIIEVPIPPRGLYSIYYNYDFTFNDAKEKNLTASTFVDIDTRQSYFKQKSQNYSYLQGQNLQVDSPYLHSTENNKLLVSDMDLEKFNKMLGFSCKLETIKHILFGSKILFFSKDINLLSDTILSFLSLIFPFKYPMQVSSFLHKTNYNILESISPFMLGINEEYKQDFFEKNEITIDGMDILVLDLDSKEEKNYYLFSSETFPEFPSKILYNLDKEIKSLESSFNNINKNNNGLEKNVKEFNEQYQEKFFHFFCEILKGYEDYLNMGFFDSRDSDKVTSTETLFNCEQFIKSSNLHYQCDIPFYEKFILDSQMFADFIYKRMIPKNNNELMDIFIVNEHMKKRYKVKGKDEQNLYAINNKYIVPRPREITEEEKKEIISHKTIIYNQGQILRKDELSLSKNNLKFEYILFPKLNFNIYCNNENVNQYIPPPDYSEEIEAINTDVISKSSLGKNINRTIEMKNYLYLTWLEIWAFTFWYNEPSEKHYRFDQMLDVLDKVIHHEMNILNLMFDVLNKHGEPQMLLKLFQKLLQLKINPSSFIYDLLSNVIDKNQIKDLNEEVKNITKNNTAKSFKFNDYNKKNNRERTFLSINDNLPLETKPKFYYDFETVCCGEKINLLSVCRNFENIRNDILWVKCPKSTCDEYNLPKITVKFGLNFTLSQSKSTSTEDFVLHSPYNLKINIKNAVVRHYGVDINISNFKSQFQPLFWNFIWYCVVHKLDYNILLPYAKNLEQLKETDFYNPNREIIEISYEDKEYNINQKKIEKVALMHNNKNKFDNLKICKRIVFLELNVMNKHLSSNEVIEVDNNSSKKVNEQQPTKNKMGLFDFLDKKK